MKKVTSYFIYKHKKESSTDILSVKAFFFIISYSKVISYETDKLSKKSQLSVNCNFILH